MDFERAQFNLVQARVARAADNLICSEEHLDLSKSLITSLSQAHGDRSFGPEARSGHVGRGTSIPSTGFHLTIPTINEWSWRIASTHITYLISEATLDQAKQGSGPRYRSRRCESLQRGEYLPSVRS